MALVSQSPDSDAPADFEQDDQTAEQTAGKQ
jgi:hypothetical protein